MERKSSFEKEFDEEKMQLNKGLKLKNKKQQLKQEVRRSFEEVVEQTQLTKEINMQEALVLGVKFMDLLKDKTLLENKGPLQKSLEQEVITDWQKYIKLINNDANAIYDGQGSLSAIVLLLHSTVRLRNRLNELEHANSVLNSKLDILSEKLENKTSKIKKLESSE